MLTKMSKSEDGLLKLAGAAKAAKSASQQPQPNTAERSTSSSSRNITPSVPLPLKLHMMLEDTLKSGQSDIVSWILPDGDCFMIHDKRRFEAEIMPKYFKATTHKSFQRTLNIWGFQTTKVDGKSGAVHHELFRRKQRHLCQGIIRVGSVQKMEEHQEALYGAGERDHPAMAKKDETPCGTTDSNPSMSGTGPSLKEEQLSAAVQSRATAAAASSNPKQYNEQSQQQASDTGTPHSMAWLLLEKLLPVLSGRMNAETSNATTYNENSTAISAGKSPRSNSAATTTRNGDVSHSDLKLINSLIPKEEDELSFSAANQDLLMAGNILSTQQKKVPQATEELTPLQALFQQADESNKANNSSKEGESLTPLQALYKQGQEQESQRQADACAAAATDKFQQQSTLSSETELGMAMLKNNSVHEQSAIARTLLNQVLGIETNTTDGALINNRTSTTSNMSNSLSARSLLSPDDLLRLRAMTNRSDHASSSVAPRVQQHQSQAPFVSPVTSTQCLSQAAALGGHHQLDGCSNQMLSLLSDALKQERTSSTLSNPSMNPASASSIQALQQAMRRAGSITDLATAAPSVRQTDSFHSIQNTWAGSSNDSTARILHQAMHRTGSMPASATAATPGGYSGSTKSIPDTLNRSSNVSPASLPDIAADSRHTASTTSLKSMPQTGQSASTAPLQDLAKVLRHSASSSSLGKNTTTAGNSARNTSSTMLQDFTTAIRKSTSSSSFQHMAKPAHNTSATSLQDLAAALRHSASSSSPSGSLLGSQKETASQSSLRGEGTSSRSAESGTKTQREHSPRNAPPLGGSGMDTKIQSLLRMSRSKSQQVAFSNRRSSPRPPVQEDDCSNTSADERIVPFKKRRVILQSPDSSPATATAQPVFPPTHFVTEENLRPTAMSAASLTRQRSLLRGTTNQRDRPRCNLINLAWSEMGDRKRGRPS